MVRLCRYIPDLMVGEPLVIQHGQPKNHGVITRLIYQLPDHQSALVVFYTKGEKMKKDSNITSNADSPFVLIYNGLINLVSKCATSVKEVFFNRANQTTWVYFIATSLLLALVSVNVGLILFLVSIAGFFINGGVNNLKDIKKSFNARDKNVKQWGILIVIGIVVALFVITNLSKKESQMDIQRMYMQRTFDRIGGGYSNSNQDRINVRQNNRY